MAPASEENKRQDAAQLLFLSCFLRSRIVGFSCYNVAPLPRTVALPSCLPLDIKVSLKEDTGVLIEGLIDGLMMEDCIDLWDV
jgi:hypothetical protein